MPSSLTPPFLFRQRVPPCAPAARGVRVTGAGHSSGAERRGRGPPAGVPLVMIADLPCAGLSLRTPISVFVKDSPQGPPTANRQPPTANRQPPTANRQPPPTTNSRTP